jgi:hypothetical protein
MAPPFVGLYTKAVLALSLVMVAMPLLVLLFMVRCLSDARAIQVRGRTVLPRVV